QPERSLRDDDAAPAGAGRRLLVHYVALVVVPVACVALALRAGRGLTGAAVATSAPAAARGTAGAAMPDLFVLLLQVAAILLVARLFGALFHRVGQPQVVGEMVAGIALGPSL